MQTILQTATEDAALSAQVTSVVDYPVIPALKVLMAAQSGSPDWERVRTPLAELAADARQQVLASIQAPA